MTTANIHPVRRELGLAARIYRDRWYLLFLMPALVLLALFSYFPMYGLSIAFQDFKVGDPLASASSNWVGFKHFISFFESHFFYRVFTNTIRLSLKFLLYGGWVSPVVALLLNEARVLWFKRTVQTCYYLPYFVSIAIVVSIMSLLTGSGGPVSALSQLFGGRAMNYMNDASSFDALYVISEIWRGFGYAVIMYLAAIANVDPNLYEAVEIDGGNRLHKMLHVTLPYIVPTMMILLILQIGSLLNASTEKILLMYNSSNIDRADVIGTYIYRVGLKDAKYSYTTAVGLFANVINFALVFGSNKLSNKLTGAGLW